MGYTTYFSGQIEVEPPLNEAEREYLHRFSGSRRMKRERGPYFANPGDDQGQGPAPDIIEHSQPPEGQPDLWCGWAPTEDGALEHTRQSAYDGTAWMVYIIDHFLKDGCVVQKALENGELSEAIAAQFEGFTFNHVCNGEVEADGEEPDDFYLIAVSSNDVTERSGYITYPLGQGQLVDSEALDRLAGFLYAKPRLFPGGADTCAELDAVLKLAGREPGQEGPQPTAISLSALNTLALTGAANDVLIEYRDRLQKAEDAGRLKAEVRDVCFDVPTMIAEIVNRAMGRDPAQLPRTEKLLGINRKE